MTEPNQTGVLLLNLGAPGSPREVRSFLFRLFRDRQIFPMPGGRVLQWPFAVLLTLLRGSKVVDRYRSLPGRGSPLLSITRRQALALEKRLRLEGLAWPVEVAMRYSRPFAPEALESLAARGARSLVALPLYPQFSTATTGSSLVALRQSVSRSRNPWSLVEILSWHDRPDLHRAIANRVAAKVLEAGGSHNLAVLFLAHSLPMRFVRAGDPYVKQIEETVRGIADAMDNLEGVKGVPTFLAYQSQVGPVEWVGPDVKRALQELRSRGARRIVVAPVSFVSDHLETLYEIDRLHRRTALEMGFEAFERIESFNDAPEFIDLLARIVLEHGGLRSGLGGIP
jgi:ferrochelatase